MTRPSETPRAKRKARLKHWHGHRLEQELAYTLEKVAILEELIVDRDRRNMRLMQEAAKASTGPRVPEPKPELRKRPRFNEWGLDLSLRPS